MTRTPWLIAVMGIAALIWLEIHPLMLGVRPVLVFMLAGVLSFIQPRAAALWGTLAGGTVAFVETAPSAIGSAAGLPYGAVLAIIVMFLIAACGAGAGRSLSEALSPRRKSRPQ